MSFHFIVSVKDRAADVFNRPFFVPHTNVAVRDFTDEINRDAADNALNRHPDDFDLYLLGQFDDNSGAFIVASDNKPSDGVTPVLLVRGKDVVKVS